MLLRFQSKKVGSSTPMYLPRKRNSIQKMNAENARGNSASLLSSFYASSTSEQTKSL